MIDDEDFLALFDKLHWHVDYETVVGPLRAFMATATDKARIEDWAIIWPQRQTPGRMLAIDGLGTEAPIWRRSRRQAPRIDFTGENKRNILSAGRVPEGAEVDGLGKSDKRGVLVISLVADQEETTEASPVAVADVVGLISLRVPDKSIQSKRELIQYGVVVSEKAGDVAVDASEAN